MIIAKVNSVAPFIKILNYDSDNTEKVECALKQIQESKAGNKLLNAIKSLSNDLHYISIFVIHDLLNATTPTLSAAHREQLKIGNNIINQNIEQFVIKKAKQLSTSPEYGGEGISVSANILWNVDISANVNNCETPHYVRGSKKAFLCLAHELIHGYYYLAGEHIPKGNDLNNHHPDETSRLLGVGKYMNVEFSENLIRKDLGEFQRHSIEFDTRIYEDRWRQFE